MTRNLGGCEAAKRHHLGPPQHTIAAAVFSHFGGLKYGKWISPAIKLCSTV